MLIGAALGNYNSGSWKVCWNDSKNKIISFYIFKNGDCKTSFLENNLCNKNYPSDVIIEYNKELTIDSEILKNLKTYSKNRKKYLEKGIPIYSNWERLYEYFSRVLVSSNNNSRISGAGAGLIDVD